MLNCRKRTRLHLGVINITQQAQEQVTTLQRGATSLTRTSPSLPAGSLSKTDVLTSRLGRTFASFNPVRHIRLARQKPNATPFIPAVWYSKNDEPTDGSTEQARILKGDKVVAAPSTLTDDLGDVTEDSIDDLDDRAWTWRDGASVEFHLTSCGIIRTSPVASATSLMRCRNSHGSASHGVVQAELPRWRNRDPRYRSDPLYDAHACATLKAETLPPHSATFSLEADGGENRTDTERVGIQPTVRQIRENTDHQVAPTDVEMSTPHDNSGRSHHCSADRKPSLDEHINISVDDATLSHPGQQHLHHPCMKTSFSEGSLSDFAPEFVEQETNDSVTSPLSRLRSKVSSLAVGTAMGARTRLDNQAQSRQLVNLALQNRVNSELRFREVRTKIILL